MKGKGIGSSNSEELSGMAGGWGVHPLPFLQEFENKRLGK
jgi:hypothetical protein